MTFLRCASFDPCEDFSTDSALQTGDVLPVRTLPRNFMMQIDCDGSSVDRISEAAFRGQSLAFCGAGLNRRYGLVYTYKRM